MLRLAQPPSFARMCYNIMLNSPGPARPLRGNAEMR